ncbi:MAG: FAD-dependent monooxygenase [bacterium]|nr:FAD-dependent monooxygenase [bacterium]
MVEPSLDVLVVGAGPVGLTLAAALTHHGVRCRLVEKAPVPSDKSKALAVWTRSMELLDGLGLADAFLQTGLRIGGGSMYAGGKRLVHLDLTGTESPFGFPLMIPQNETERLLAEHLAGAGVAVERGVELTGFVETADAVQATLRHPDGRDETLVVPWLVGCDGAHSTVRHTLGMEFAGHPDPSDWMLADVHVAGDLARDEVSIFWNDEGVLAVFPIDRRRVRLIADQGIAQPGKPEAEVTLAHAQAVLDARGPGGLVLSDPIWLTNFRINERKVAEYRRGRVMLAGDAAHIHSPAGGQGMNTGMQDAFNLAWKLALIQRGRGQTEPLLRSYSVERSAVGDQVLRNAERFTTIATLRSPIARWLRDHIAPIVGAFGAVQERVRNEWWELSINYRQSPLSWEQWPPHGGGLPAGDRLCDAPLTAPDGDATSVFTVLRGARRQALLLIPASHARDAVARLAAIAADAAGAFPDLLDAHVVLPAGSAPTLETPGVCTWIDTEGRLHDRLHATVATLVVVRPDGYVGFRCQPADGHGLLAYLGRYLVGGGAG